MYAFLITLREGLEAALIIGILLAYLDKAGNQEAKRSVWTGTALAIGSSLGGGLLIYWLVGGLSGKTLDSFEGLMMLLATAVLTWMILLMQRTARDLKATLTGKMDAALTSGGRWGLTFLAFAVVGREGLETVLFLAGGTATAASGLLYLLSGVMGGLLAALLGWGIYRGSMRLNLRKFFTFSGLVLIVFGAGMLANGMKELHEAQWVPALVAHVWDTYNLLSDTSVAGRLLAALLGYDSSPSLVQVLAYFGYLLLTGTLFVLGLNGSPKKRKEVSA
ncbi:MAG: FTR1 family iron permease [Mycobacterium leprae]